MLEAAVTHAFYIAMPDDAGTWIQEAQRKALAPSELLLVNENMAAIAFNAAHSVPHQILLRAEFPAENGPVAWAGPFAESKQDCRGVAGLAGA